MLGYTNLVEDNEARDTGDTEGAGELGATRVGVGESLPGHSAEIVLVLLSAAVGRHVDDLELLASLDDGSVELGQARSEGATRRAEVLESVNQEELAYHQ